MISDTILTKFDNFLGHFLHGLKLKSYDFKKYKTKNEKKNLFLLMLWKEEYSTKSRYIKVPSRGGGTLCKRFSFWPGNVLHPDEYAKRLSALRKIGLKIKMFMMTKN